jgi:hypothetical protein
MPDGLAPTYSVAYAQNPHKVPGNPIADDVRIHQRPLTQIGAGNKTTPLVKISSLSPAATNS